MRSVPFIAALVVFAAPVIAAERRFTVGAFDAITLSGGMDVTATTGGAVSVVADGSQSDLDRLDIRTEGNRLIIAHRRDSNGSWTDSSPRVRVSVPKLTAATVSGSGDMVIDRVDAQSFTGRISGSGDLNIGTLRTGAADLSISGSGDMRASGRCTALTARISGSGDMALGGLVCETVDASVNGSGDIVVQATKSGKLATSGSGDIRVTGGATCTVRKSGSGEIVCG